MTEALRLELKPLGIQVTSLEPNGVATPMTSFPEQEAIDLWKTFPPHLLSEYRRFWRAPGEVLGKTASSFWSPEKFAKITYKKVITAKHMKPRYVLGPSAWILPTLDRWVSKTAQERIFERMFRRA